MGDNPLSPEASMENVRRLYAKNLRTQLWAALEHFDDGIEHSLWLSLMHGRVALLRELLSPDGALLVHLDGEEVHYMKVMLDEVFGRRHYLGQVAYERSGVSGIGQGGSFLVNTHEYILCYARDISQVPPSAIRGRSCFHPRLSGLCRPRACRSGVPDRCNYF